MAIRNKIFYSEWVLNEIYTVRSRDEKIDYREVILVMDSVANLMAKEGLLEFWKLGATNSIDEHWISRFEWLTPTDNGNNPSYVSIPATYLTLPNNGGISEVYFKNDPAVPKKKYFDPVLVLQARDIPNYRNTLGGDLEGRIGCYPKSGVLYFTKPRINATYGTIGMSLLIRDSSQIADDALFPIDPAMEFEFISRCVQWFRNRRSQPVDLIKDNNDKP